MSPSMRIKDLGYIIDNYGYPKEICGHACDRTALVNVLLKRVMQTDVFAEIMQALLDYGTVKGQLPDYDRHLAVIYRRWASEGMVTLSPAQQLQVNNLKYPASHKKKA